MKLPLVWVTMAFAAATAAMPFRQPAEAVVERYTRDGVRLRSTDQYGEITLPIDGNNLDVFTFAGSDGRMSGEAGGVEGLLVREEVGTTRSTRRRALCGLLR